MDRRLVDYLPPVLSSVREFAVLMDEGAQPEAEALWHAAAGAYADAFILEATENGVSRWEAMLAIRPKATDTLSDRRFRVLSRLSASLPYTEAVLASLLAALCGAEGYALAIDHHAYALHVKVNLTAKSNFDDVKALLRRIVPANMAVTVEQLYNNYGVLAGFTQAELARYTQYELRNEVLTHAG